MRSGSLGVPFKELLYIPPTSPDFKIYTENIMQLKSLNFEKIKKVKILKMFRPNVTRRPELLKTTF